jgi:hypothetical protein
MKISQMLLIVFLSKILRKNLQKFCQIVAPKNLSEKISDFPGKFVDIKFYEFVRKFSELRFFLIELALVSKTSFDIHWILFNVNEKFVSF